jgi:ABC-2 type transport system ATP-binding protein
MRSMGKTILVSSHILPELGEMCTGVAIIDRGEVLRSGTIDEIERSLRASVLIRIDVLGDASAVEAARAWLMARDGIEEIVRLDDTTAGTARLEMAFDGDGEAQAELLRAMVEAGHRVAGFSQATTDLEEIFLRVTGQRRDEAIA